MIMSCTALAEGNKIGYTCMDGTNPFFVTLEASIREVVEAHGDQLISLDPQNSNEKQISQIEDLISQGIVAMFVNPVDRDGIIAGLDKLKEAGIPMFGFDTEVADMSYLVSYAGSDNYNAGFVCGEDLVAKCPEGGNIIVLDSPTMQSVVDRTDGFLAAIEGKGFTVVSQIDCMGNQEQGNLNGTDALTAHPDAVAIFGGNDPTALGAYAAAEAAGSKALIYGVDGSPDIKALIADGKVTGTGAQSPMSIGKTIAEVYYKVEAGETVEARYPIPTFMINADNVAEFGTDGWQ
ncbi:MAG: sugar ABC transporter substrate-binding protein [Clostridiales bacterium]|nr:sugar ABC transporter substrate-binding protein [Clostridiales bacterium]MDY3764428.1 sugar ABC transporter substrate-binding protein [Candidatus Ventricola sp.]MDY4541506.1 sugar ABC transporter substrate-binding protein [Candidatus Ventricola sp.]MDY4856087.1 sugar ABC transporter substrate-binding protein [Candidatus Ventricola sp.]